MKDTNYYQTEYEKKNITLVDQKYSKRNGKFERAEVWNLCKRFAEHPQAEPLPEVHKVVKSFAFFLGCKKFVKYGGSFLFCHTFGVASERSKVQALLRSEYVHLQAF